MGHPLLISTVRIVHATAAARSIVLAGSVVCALLWAAGACTARTSRPRQDLDVFSATDARRERGDGGAGDSGMAPGDSSTVPPCVPESTTVFCGRVLGECGSMTALDNCQDTREVDCGACPSGIDRCGGSGVANVCGHGECAGEALLTFPTAGGAGSNDDPFVLCTADQLNALNDSAPYMSATFSLRQDIDLSELASPYTPIGSASVPFGGELLGNGRTIKNLSIDAPGHDDVGLFGSLTGKVSALTLEGVRIDAANLSRVGALAGSANMAHIRNVVMDLSDNGTVPTIIGGAVVGGLLGSAVDTLIEDCTSHADVIASGSNVGGLVGNTDRSTTRRCITAGSVTSVTGHRVGGLLGYCYSNEGADMSSSSATVIGGTRVGGLIGYQSGFCNARNSHATGDVTGENEVGGLTGGLNTLSSLVGCYASGRVVATGDTGGNQNAGGLIGDTAATNRVSTSFWDTDVNSDLQGVPLIADGPDITGLTSMAMRSAAPFAAAGWDMATLWSVVSSRNSGLPTLHTARTPCPGPAFDPLAWGLGTPAVPHYLCSAEQVLQLALPANQPFQDRTYALVADINISGRPADPIGTTVAPFTGNFFGNGHTITGLEITATGTSNSDVGFFGSISGSTIDAVHLVVPRVVTSGSSQRVGILAGHATGAQISNCIVRFGEESSMPSTMLLVQSAEGTPSSDIGVAVGRCTDCVIDGVMAAASVTVGDAGRQLGGIVGTSDNTSIANSEANITFNVGVLASGIGGLVGLLDAGSTISLSGTRGQMELGRGSTRVGGLVGSALAASSINGGWSHAEIRVVTGADPATVLVGGLVGEQSANSSVSNSFAAGRVEADGVVGGLIGTSTDSQLSDSHASGVVVASSLARGVIGAANGTSTVSNVVWQPDRSPGVVESVPGAAQITAEDAASPATFIDLGWLFFPVGLWRYDVAGEYPTLAAPL